MQFSLDANQGNYTIKAYAAGEVIVNDQVYKQSLIVSPTHLTETWRPQSCNDLTLADLTAIFSLKPEIVLLGTGTTLQFPHPEIISEFHQQHIGIEVMDMGAACRTFTVLVSEGRNVVAALLIS